MARIALWLLMGLAVLVPTPGQAQTTVKYVHTDALGSVVAMTDATGAIIETTHEYEPYGRQLAPAIQDGPGYTGHVQDAATGLTYMQQRYYDPMLGVFLSVDPVTAYEKPITNFNRYVYARNNPYKFTDPDGRDVTCNGMTCNIRCQGAECVSDFAKYGMIRMVSDAADLARILFPIIQQSESNEPGPTSEGGAPPLPEGLVGEGQTPRSSGNSVTSGPLKPEFGGSGDYESDLGTLAGETRPAGPGDAAPLGAQIGENGVFGRENSSGGRSIDIPANGDKPHETLHYPREE